MQSYFQVSPPSVHQMVLSLEKLRFIERTPGQGRSLKLLLPREQLPDLTGFLKVASRPEWMRVVLTA